MQRSSSLSWMIATSTTSLVVVFVVITLVDTARAGDTTPDNPPAATNYTLEDIYTRLTTNATSTEGDHDFSPSAPPAATGYSLTQIYDTIPTIVGNTVLTGTEYLGIDGTFDVTSLTNSVIKQGTTWGENAGLTGTLTPNEGDATAADLFNGKTAHLTADWSVDSGTLNLACNTISFNGTDNLVNGSYDGSGDGTNRWCVTSDESVTTSTLLSSATAWIDGVLATGVYDVSLLTNSVIKQGITWGASGSQTGTLTPNEGDATAADLFNGKTAHLTADWSIDSGTLNLACNTVTFDGSANLVGNSYDGSGDGTNRWCVTSSGTATASNMLSGSVAWVDGIEITGTMTSVGQQLITPTTTNQTITQGYHNGTGYCAGDADLTAANIRSGITIFDVAGSYEVNLPTCSFGGTTGNVYAKNSACTWTDSCQVGVNCSDSCVVSLVTHNVDTTTSFTAECGGGLSVLSEPCDLCIID